MPHCWEDGKVGLYPSKRVGIGGKDDEIVISRPIDMNLLDEGHIFPARTYAETVLEPAYNNAKSELLAPMTAINKAHLVMLRKEALIGESDARSIAGALLSLNLQKLQQGTFTGQYEDLFFEVEHELLSIAGEAAGNLHLARSRNDTGIAMYRLVLREKLLTAIRSALLLQRTLIAFADGHLDTIMKGIYLPHDPVPVYISGARYKSDNADGYMGIKMGGAYG